MALAKINNIEIEFNSLRDCVWRLTNRIFIVEDFIKKQFGNVLDPCCTHSNSTKTKRKKVTVKRAKRSTVNLRPRKKRHVEEITDTEEEEVEDEDSSNLQDNLSPIKSEHLSEVMSDEEQIHSVGDPFLQEVNSEENSSKTQEIESEASSGEENEFELEYPTNCILPDKPSTSKKRTWTHLKDFSNKEAAEAELLTEWTFKYTLEDIDGSNTIYHCQHEIGTCPAKVRLVTLNTIESASLMTNGMDHVHSEDIKYGFNFTTKKIIDTLMAEGVTESEPMMKALQIRNIEVEQKFINRYLGGHKKQLGLFNKSPSAKRLSYTASFKLKVCQSAEKVGNREAAREFNLNESSIRKWRKSIDALKTLAPQRSSFRRKGAKWPSLEKELTEWIAKQKDAGETVTTASVREEASRIAQRQKLTDFRSSLGWQERFLKRIGESFSRRKPKKTVETTTVEEESEEVATVLPAEHEIQNIETETIADDENISVEFHGTIPPVGFPINTWYVEYVQPS